MNAKRFAMVALVASVLLFVSHEALAFYNPETGRWLNRDPINEQGFKRLARLDDKKPAAESTPYAFVHNSGINHYDYLGLSGTGSGGAECAITGYNSGRVSFRGFPPGKLAEFRLITEDGKIGGMPDASGSSSDHVDGFWWKGIKTHWYKLPGFCWAIVRPEFSEDGFSMTWCCDDCTRLLCRISTVLKKRPCTPGFVPNSGDTYSGTDYPF